MSIGVPEKIHLAANAMKVQEYLSYKKTLITRMYPLKLHYICDASHSGYSKTHFWLFFLLFFLPTIRCQNVLVIRLFNVHIYNVYFVGEVSYVFVEVSIGVPEKIHLAANAMKVQEHLDMSIPDKKTLITRILIARSIRLNCITFALRHTQAIARHISGCFFSYFLSSKRCCNVKETSQ